jgi:putative phosphoribosyl transferase
VKFTDRTDAGYQLARLIQEKLPEISSLPEQVIVLAMPRGGVVTGIAISQQLDLALDVILVRKLGSPHNPELAVGAIAEEDVVVLNDLMIHQLGLQDPELHLVITKEQQELARRLRLYRKKQPFPRLENKIVILVDDGLATGMTALAASRVIKHHQPAKIVLAVPVCVPNSVRQLELEVDKIICINYPINFSSVGQFYQHFEPVEDHEIVEMLEKIRA